MALPITTTARLRVRPYILQDMEHRHRLTTELYGEPAAAHTRQWLEWTVAAYRELGRLYQPPYGDYVVELQETGAVIGSVGLVPSLVPWGVLNPQTPAPQRYLTSPEFGLYWAMLPAHQGNGYAAEAAQVIIDVVFTRLQGQRVVATTEHANLRSQRVMHKLGMHILKNTSQEPPWFEVVGILGHPDSRPA